MGQLFMMGFDGTTVSPQIRSLIEDYHLGSVLLSAKNLKCIYFLFPSLGTNLSPLPLGFPLALILFFLARNSTDLLLIFYFLFLFSYSCGGSNTIGLRIANHCPQCRSPRTITDRSRSRKWRSQQFI